MWAGKQLDLQCPPPVVFSSAPQRQSDRLESRRRGRQKQKGHSYDVGEWRHTPPGLFRRQSEDPHLQGLLEIWLRLFCAIDRGFYFCWYRCCFWVGLMLRSEWVSMGWDRRAGHAEFSGIRPKVGGEAPKRQEGDIRGGEEP